MTDYPVGAYRRQSAARLARGFRGPVFIVVVDDIQRPRAPKYVPGVSTIPSLPSGDLYNSSYRRIVVQALRYARVFGRAVPYANVALLGLDAAELAFGPLDSWIGVEAVPVPVGGVQAGSGWSRHCFQPGVSFVRTGFALIGGCPLSSPVVDWVGQPFWCVAGPTVPPVANRRIREEWVHVGDPAFRTEPEYKPDGAPGQRTQEQALPDWLVEVDPMTKKPLEPPSKPQPKPVVLHQVGNAESPHPMPKPWPNRLPRPTRSRPGKGRKESKLQSPSWVLPRVARLLNYLTESLDALGVIYNALPSEMRRQHFRDLGFNYPRPQDKVDFIYRNWQDIDMEGMLIGLAANQIEDYVYGRVGSYLGRETAHQLGRSYLYGPAI